MQPTSLQRLVDPKGNGYLRYGDETRNTTSHVKWGSGPMWDLHMEYQAGLWSGDTNSCRGSDR
jgi:hypothetical protein